MKSLEFRVGLSISTVMVASFGVFIPGSVIAEAKATDGEAYFGPIHQHTSWSLDAYILGNAVAGPVESC